MYLHMHDWGTDLLDQRSDGPPIWQVYVWGAEEVRCQVKLLRG